MVKELFVGCCVVVGTAGCGERPAEPEPPAARGLGRVNLQLTAEGAEVESIAYTIRRGPNRVVESATIDVGPDEAVGSTWVLLPPGEYSVQLTSEAVPSAVPPSSEPFPCFGEGTFEVTAGSTSVVDVELTCLVPGVAPARGAAEFDITFVFEELEPCALSRVFVAPTRTAANGGVIVLQSAAVGPADLEFEWSVDGPGVIADPSAAYTTYTCDGPAEARLTVRVSDRRGFCEDAASVTVLCISSTRCGNGVHEPWLDEPCDASDPESPGPCTRACTAIVCGDGHTQGEEECDDGNLDPNDGCDQDCVVETCGDGIVNVVGEECDPPDAEAGGACGADCRLVPALDCEPVATCSAPPSGTPAAMR